MVPGYRTDTLEVVPEARRITDREEMRKRLLEMIVKSETIRTTKPR